MAGPENLQKEIGALQVRDLHSLNTERGQAPDYSGLSTSGLWEPVRNFDVKSARTLNFIGNAGHEIGSVLLENFNAEVLAPGDPCIVKGCNGLEFKNVTINGRTYPDGPVAGEAGDDSPLSRSTGVSWEQRRKK